MSSERWRHIEGIFHDALERPPAERATFIRDACGGDELLCQEVESLLGYESRADALGSRLGITDSGLGMSGVDLIGKQIGVYKIQSLLGAGGMGEVYRARDTKLGRDVAIKVLPCAFMADANRLARFRREARVLATLNHPNVGAIYGLEESDGRHALVLELVEGPTLADRIATGALTVEESLKIAREIAAAVEAAHAKGIVHRDLKPANITLTPDGHVKVLDFGLAKAGAIRGHLSQAPTVTIDGTEAGMILGTAAYMSPEQARGDTVDTRSDVWAFGSVLFEMLAGRAPFCGATIPDTIARIIGGEPDWSTLPRSTPVRIRALLKNCLQKDPERRLENLSVAGRDIDACLASPFKTPVAILESLKWSASRRTVQWGLAGVILAAASATVFLLGEREVPVPRLTNPVQVTSALGVESHPGWAPDGRTLVYESNESANWDVWVTQVGGSAVNRTIDHAGSDRYPSWSPDGRQIAFWSEREGGGYYVMPALGGPAQRIVHTSSREISYSAPVWSVDGLQLGVVNYRSPTLKTESYFQIVTLATREVRDVLLPGVEEARLDVTWSPDHRFLAYVDAASQLSEIGVLKILQLSDSKVIDLTEGRSNVRSPRWSTDGRHLFFVSNREGATDWWRLRTAGDGNAMGQPQRVTTGLEVPNGAFTLDGKRLAYSKGRWVSNAWRVPLLQDRPATWADAEQVTFDQGFIEFLDISADGRTLAYSSDRTGNQELWTLTIGSSPARRLTFDVAPDWSPAWSPDGTKLVYYSFRSGNRDIWVMPSAGGAATRLTDTAQLEAVPRWSPDGRRIAFRSERTGNSEIWVMNADGGDQRQLTNDPEGDGSPSWSPDGLWLAYGSNRGGEGKVWRMRSDGTGHTPVARGALGSLYWSPDGTQIVFVGADERRGNLWGHDVATSSDRPLTNLFGRRGMLGLQPPATDGKYIYFVWRDDLGDIWVMDVEGQ